MVPILPRPIKFSHTLLFNFYIPMSRFIIYYYYYYIYIILLYIIYYILYYIILYLLYIYIYTYIYIHYMFYILQTFSSWLINLFIAIVAYVVTPPPASTITSHPRKSRSPYNTFAESRILTMEGIPPPF